MPDYTLKAPGVYIEEIPATGPIAGVGTSTAAFIGPFLYGTPNTPLLVTNWTQFKNAFGQYQSAQQQQLQGATIYTPYAVRGFFDNGGTTAYIVRVWAGQGSAASADLSDRGGGTGKALHVQAQIEGSDGNNFSIAVQNAQIANTIVQKATANASSASGNTITLQNPPDASLFKPFDYVTIVNSTERAQIGRIVGNQLILLTNLTGTYPSTPGGAAPVVRIADLVAKQPSFRLQNATGIEPGSVINLKQGNTTENHVVDSVVGSFVTLHDSLTNTFSMSTGTGATDVTVTTFEFSLFVYRSGQPTALESFLNLSMDPRHSRYFGNAVNSAYVNVTLPGTPSTQTPPLNSPAAVGPTPLTGGADDDPDAIGSVQYQAGIDALQTIKDVNLVCVPGVSDPTIVSAVVTHCEQMGDRFAILDSAQGATLSEPNNVNDQRTNATSTFGYAAIYYPWISVGNPVGSGTVLVPPSGHIAGIYARSDNNRGVHKAPANELINGALNLEVILNDADQGVLNAAGINVLRLFPGQPPAVWGARTTAPPDQTAWRYINVRRLFIFVEQSLLEGLRWAVFEPNDIGLWNKLERTITEFLTRVWGSGALFGNTASDAFYVKIDAELNPPSVQALGQIIIEIGIAPVRPAEFVIVRIAMWDGGSQASEG
jgi:uncharacterized protein